jgi:hypothetical protein
LNLDVIVGDGLSVSPVRVASLRISFVEIYSCNPVTRLGAYASL